MKSVPCDRRSKGPMVTSHATRWANQNQAVGGVGGVFPVQWPPPAAGIITGSLSSRRSVSSPPQGTTCRVNHSGLWFFSLWRSAGVLPTMTTKWRSSWSGSIPSPSRTKVPDPLGVHPPVHGLKERCFWNNAISDEITTIFYFINVHVKVYIPLIGLVAVTFR